MKQVISLSLIVLVLSGIVWFHWGGLANSFGTFIIAIVDLLIISVIIDNFLPKKVK